MTSDDVQPGEELPGQLDTLSAQRLKTVLESNAGSATQPPAFGGDDGRYRIDGVLGRGGMGMVLRANDRFFERDVAVKILHTHHQVSNRDLLRFVEEAQVTGQLEHPNIIPVHELDRAVDGSIYYTMKQVRGDTLQDVIDRLKKNDPPTIEEYPLNRLLDIFTKVCDAVAYAHSKGVVHRDIKPANIMIGAYGEVLLLDWGLSRVMGLPDLRDDQTVSSLAREEMSELTQEGATFGTPGYASPEQIRSADSAGEPSDLYSLGAVLYAILTLQPPVGGRSAQQRFALTLRGAIDPPQARVDALPHLPGRHVPAALSAVAMKALSTEPGQRYDSVAEFRNEVQAYLAGFATTAEQAGLLRRLQLLCRRYPWESAISGIAAALLALATIGTLVHLHTSRAEAAGILSQTKRLHKKAEAGRKTKERHLSEIKKSAVHLAEQSGSSLGNLRRHRTSSETKEGKFYNWSSIVATREIESAIALDPTNPSFWYQKGLTLETPDLRFPAKANGEEGDWSQGQTHWKLDEAAEALSKAIDLSADAPDVNKLARRELAKVYELMSLTREDGSLLPIALVRLLNWMALSGRRREANILRIPLAKMSAGKLNARRNELAAAGLSYHQPGSWASASLATYVRSTRYQKPDFSALKGALVDSLDIAYPGEVDLSPLKDTGLSQLSVDHTRLRDLSPLRGMALDTFIMNDGVMTDLSPLDGMPLRILRLHNTPITKLPDLSNASLIELRISGTKITDISPVAHMALRRFHSHGTPLDNLDALAGMPLDVIHFCSTNVKTLKPLADVSPCVIKANESKLESLDGPRTDRLTEVRINDTFVHDLSPLNGSKVRVLWLANCPVEDLDPLKGVPLRDLRLEGTKIKNIEALAGMDLRRLDITGCAVSDLTPLFGSRIRFLDIDGTMVREMKQLLRLPKLLSLRIDSSQTSAFRKILPDLEELYRFAVDDGPWIIRRDFARWLKREGPAR